MCQWVNAQGEGCLQLQLDRGGEGHRGRCSLVPRTGAPPRLVEAWTLALRNTPIRGRSSDAPVRAGVRYIVNWALPSRLSSAWV